MERAGFREIAEARVERFDPTEDHLEEGKRQVAEVSRRLGERMAADQTAKIGKVLRRVLDDSPLRPPRVRPYVAIGRKIGRNEPCPCGSGKKFKKCCRGLIPPDKVARTNP